MRHQRLLREKYKTYHGAAGRAAFERGIAPGEYERGYKARLYNFRVVEHDGFYRVERFVSGDLSAADFLNPTLMAKRLAGEV